MSDIAQFLWVEGTLSQIEKLCLSSFLKNGYETHLYTYGEVSGVPDGVKILPGEKILAAEKLFEAPGVSGLSYAGFSDRFRYHLLSQKGGWWFDMDFVCLKHLPKPDQLTFASTWEGQWGQCANGCAMWCEPNDPHLVALREQCEEVIASSAEVEFGKIGPFLVQKYVADHGLEDRVSPWWEFCPYPWRMIERLAQRDLAEWAKDKLRSVKHQLREVTHPEFKGVVLQAGTRAIHLHNEIWKEKGLDKDRTYFRFSPIQRLKRRYA